MILLRPVKYTHNSLKSYAIGLSPFQYSYQPPLFPTVNAEVSCLSLRAPLWVWAQEALFYFWLSAWNLTLRAETKKLALKFVEPIPTVRVISRW